MGLQKIGTLSFALMLPSAFSKFTTMRKDLRKQRVSIEKNAERAKIPIFLQNPQMTLPYSSVQINESKVI